MLLLGTYHLNFEVIRYRFIDDLEMQNHQRHNAMAHQTLSQRLVFVVQFINGFTILACGH